MNILKKSFILFLCLLLVIFFSISIIIKKVDNNILLILNIITFCFITILLFKKTKDTKEKNIIIKLDNLNHINSTYENFINNLLNTISIFDKNQNIKKDNLESINETVKIITQKAIKNENIEEKTCNELVLILYEIYHKIPYLKELLLNITVKTEDAANVLIEKFAFVSDENSKANREAQKELNLVKSNKEGTGFENIIADSKESISKYEDQIKEILKQNSESTKSINKIREWIDQISNMLISIEEISEQNKIISINSSIEAARLGEKGKGFQILAHEIRTLNQKTTDFTHNINGIIKSFRLFTDGFMNDWNTNTIGLVSNIETANNKIKNAVNGLINSYESITSSFIKLSESTNKVDLNLSDILESLQFQDITRQQIENVIKFFNEIHNVIIYEKDKFKVHDIDVEKYDETIIKKIQHELLKEVTVNDERNIIRKK